MSSPSRPPALVLDTNVVLDWLVFRDPSSHPVARAVTGGRVVWLACARMRQELEHVLTRDALSAWAPDIPATLSIWDRWVETQPDVMASAHGGLRCSDPDDQIFLDLALRHGAAALLSRDRALLKLAGVARRLGLQVLTPEAWARSFSGEAAQ